MSRLEDMSSALVRETEAWLVDAEVDGQGLPGDVENWLNGEKSHGN